MPTVSDLIHSSFRLIGAIAAGEILEANELNDALVSLNQMISSWNTEGLSIVGRKRILIPIDPQHNAYIVPGGPDRPVKIESASAGIQGIDSGLEIVDSAGWEAVPEKDMLAIFVKKLFCDYQFPNSTVFLWPTPRYAGVLELWVYVPIVLFQNLTDGVNLPPGYEQALRYNFAVALLPEYPRSQADPSLAPQAQMFKASIVQLNASNHAITPNPNVAPAIGRGNIQQ